MVDGRTEALRAVEVAIDEFAAAVAAHCAAAPAISHADLPECVPRRVMQCAGQPVLALTLVVSPPLTPEFGTARRAELNGGPLKTAALAVADRHLSAVGAAPLAVDPSACTGDKEAVADRTGSQVDPATRARPRCAVRLSLLGAPPGPLPPVRLGRAASLTVWPEDGRGRSFGAPPQTLGA